MIPLRVGDVLYGFCDGWFGDEYGRKRVEAIGADWVVIRNELEVPRFAYVNPESLIQFKE